MPDKKKEEKEQPFDPNTPSPKEVGYEITPDQRRRYNAYAKRRFAETDNPGIPDIETWARINK
jgi:hypothetical protein